MSYLNQQTGYREELLGSRSIVKKENYVLLEPDGLVKNSIPGFKGCDVSILGSPAMGATFADYLVSVQAGGRHPGFGDEGIEVFLYVISGELVVDNGERKETLKEGGYIFSPAGKKVAFSHAGGETARVYLYKRRYEPLEGHQASTVVGNANHLDWISYEDMDNCHIKNLLPAADDFGFDFNFHILRFKLGASHGYIETHIQQHGMYFLSGKAMYRLDNDWVPVKKGDYIFMDAYCPQACYGVGREEDLIYIYSKDCNRDVKL